MFWKLFSFFQYQLPVAFFLFVIVARHGSLVFFIPTDLKCPKLIITPWEQPLRCAIFLLNIPLFSDLLLWFLFLSAQPTFTMPWHTHYHHLSRVCWISGVAWFATMWRTWGINWHGAHWDRLSNHWLRFHRLFAMLLTSRFPTWAINVYNVTMFGIFTVGHRIEN